MQRPAHPEGPQLTRGSLGTSNLQPTPAACVVAGGISRGALPRAGDTAEVIQDPVKGHEVTMSGFRVRPTWLWHFPSCVTSGRARTPSESQPSCLKWASGVGPPPLPPLWPLSADPWEQSSFLLALSPQPHHRLSPWVSVPLTRKVGTPSIPLLMGLLGGPTGGAEVSVFVSGTATGPTRTNRWGLPQEEG